MTEVYRRMQSDKYEESATKCRERRRRRIDMRRAAISGAGNRMESLSALAEEKRIRTTIDVPAASNSGDDAEAEALSGALAGEPVFGTISVSGRSREMEDAISVKTSLCRPDFTRRRPVHFFAVYDGHAGSHVAAMCRERMHVFVQEEAMRVSYSAESESGEGSSSREEEKQQGEEGWRRVIKRSFERMDEVAMNTCVCGSAGYQCGCHSMEVALGGSTAVVAILTPEHIVVANCGDSRAVLCRAGKAVPLSSDHKPDRPDELARVEAAGGRVIFVDGARVEGILAMSRAIGDKYLKPIVISEPEVTCTKREPEDECLILASDGLWDVLSSGLACEVASECLREVKPPPAVALDPNAKPQVEDEGEGALFPSRSVSAAALLTRLALGRKSSDNISVIVVDLKRS